MKSKTQLHDIIQIIFINTIFIEQYLMAESEIGSANLAITKTFIPFFETFGTSVYVDMGRQLVQNFAKFDLERIIIFIYLSYNLNR